MDFLLDTHALIWWMESSPRLTDRAASAIANKRNRILISAAVGWELSIKVNSGKISLPISLEKLTQSIESYAFVAIPISMSQTVRAGLLPLHHRDPFDRLLVAQARELDVPIVSNDVVLDAYGVQRLW
jgi:PIN domain nuclease of toxin-antitoxin system